MLESLVAEKVIDYFAGHQWRELIEVLERGRSVRHLHLYTESVLHPHDVEQVARGYFEKRGFTYQRKPGFLGHGAGVTNVYYIHPREDMAHFEIFMAYNSDAVLQPASASNTREGASLEYWDDAYMGDFHGRFPFRDAGEGERDEIQAYFESEHWTQTYDYMMTEGIHSHVPVYTSINPEALKEIGSQVMAAKGWKLSKADAVAYSMKGHEQGKITFLLSQPEIVVELDWEYKPGVVIEPRSQGMSLKMTSHDFEHAVRGHDYYRLDAALIARIVERL